MPICGPEGAVHGGSGQSSFGGPNGQSTFGGYGAPGSGIVDSLELHHQRVLGDQSTFGGAHPEPPTQFVGSGDACGGGFCGVGNLCCEPQETTTSTNWAYVGEGNGSFSTLPMYNYVGDGAGNYEREDVVSYRISGCRPQCLGILCCLASIGLVSIPLMAWWHHLSATAQTAPTSAPVDLTSPHWATGSNVTNPTAAPNCLEGWHSWRTSWGADKKLYCCNTYGRGCEVRTTMAQTSASGTQRAMVVKPPALTLPQPLPNPVPVPAPAARAPVAAATTSLPYDCAAGLSNWVAGWSSSKKDWCCRNAGAGCGALQTTSSCPPQDCNAGFSNWRSGWTPQKKAWCCTHENKACE